MKIFVSWVGVLLALAHSVFADDAGGIQSSNRFEISCSGSIHGNVLGEEQQVDANVKYIYSILQKDRQIVVMMHSQDISSSGKGRGVDNMTGKMSRTAVAFNPAGKPPIYFTYEDAPPGLQQMMRDTFDAPLYSMTLDEVGNELTYKETAGPGAALTMKNGAVQNTRLFHPPFYKDKTNWVVRRSISGGFGTTPTGNISYIKTPVGSNGMVSVSFSGVLTLGKDESGGLATITNLFSKVSGEETYNTNINQWETGRLTVVISYESMHEGKIIGDTHGTLSMDFKRFEN